MAPLKIETGRYLGQPLDARICTFCPNHIKNEQQVILQFPAYDSLRQTLFRKVTTLCEGFCRIDDTGKIIVLFSAKFFVHTVAKTCFLIRRERNNLLYIKLFLVLL